MNLGWLKTVGKIAAKVGIAAAQSQGIDLTSFLPPKIAPIVSAVQNIVGKSHLGEIGDVVVHVETLSERLSQPLPGPEKLKAAAPEVSAIFKDFLKVRGIEIENEVEYDAAMGDLTNSVVRAFNACKAPKS